MKVKVLNEVDLKSGDILLCSSSQTSEKINELTDSDYSHAAIYLGKGKIAESASGGVRIVLISSLLKEYDHLAVLRNPYIWNERRLKELRRFIDKAINNSASFNRIGMGKYAERKEQHSGSGPERLDKYFEGKLPAIEHDRSTYFCSELVVAAFLSIGAIDQSAAVVITPEVFSPGDVAKEAVFGVFIGYIKSSNEHEIPESDDFYYQSLIACPEKI